MFSPFPQLFITFYANVRSISSVIFWISGHKSLGVHCIVLFIWVEAAQCGLAGCSHHALLVATLIPEQILSSTSYRSRANHCKPDWLSLFPASPAFPLSLPTHKSQLTPLHAKYITSTLSNAANNAIFSVLNVLSYMILFAPMAWHMDKSFHCYQVSDINLIISS